MANTTELLQARFRELCAERDALLAQSEPIKTQRAALQEEVENLTVRIKDLTGQIRAVEDARLQEIASDISALVKALNGKTGPQRLD